MKKYLIFCLLFNNSAFALQHLSEANVQPVIALVIDGVPLTYEQARNMVDQNQILLDAIKQVESGDSDHPSTVESDGGLAHGWFQIHHAFIADAIKGLESNVLHRKFRRITESLSYSQLAVVGYWHHYGAAKTDQEKALLFHYGFTQWNADKKSDKDGYWAKVEKAMDENSKRKEDDEKEDTVQ